MHSGNRVNGLGWIVHLPSVRALSRPRPLTRLPSCTKTRNALETGNLNTSFFKIDAEIRNAFPIFGVQLC